MNYTQINEFWRIYSISCGELGTIHLPVKWFFPSWHIWAGDLTIHQCLTYSVVRDYVTLQIHEEEHE